MVKVTERKDRPGYRRVQMVYKGTSRTEQAHRESCDIKNIMKRCHPQMTYGTIGDAAMYGDFSQAGTYQEALNKLIAYRDEFMSLSPAIRKRFDNNPEKLIEFLGNEKNREEAISLGILEKPAEPSQPATDGNSPGNSPATATAAAAAPPQPTHTA